MLVAQKVSCIYKLYVLQQKGYATIQVKKIEILIKAYEKGPQLKRKISLEKFESCM